jgi:hypothetical protein
MVCYVENAINLWSYLASPNLIIILGKFLEVARPILDPRLLLVIWVKWNTSDLFVEKKTSSMPFVMETRILFVCLEDISGSLTSNLKGKRFIVRIDHLYSCCSNETIPNLWSLFQWENDAGSVESSQHIRFGWETNLYPVPWNKPDILESKFVSRPPRKSQVARGLPAGLVMVRIGSGSRPLHSDRSLPGSRDRWAWSLCQSQTDQVRKKAVNYP